MLSAGSGSFGCLAVNLLVQLIDGSVGFQGVRCNPILAFHALDLEDELSRQQGRHIVVDNLSPISRSKVSEMCPSFHRYIYLCMNGDLLLTMDLR